MTKTAIGSRTISSPELELQRLSRIAEDCFVVLDRLRSAADHVAPQDPIFRKLTSLMQAVAGLLDDVMAAQARLAPEPAVPPTDATTSPERRRSAA